MTSPGIRSLQDTRDRLHAIVMDEASIVHSEAHTRYFLHPDADRPAVVLLHGLTSSPRQFDAIGRLCFERGANVIVPRLPFHGLSNPLTTEIARLTTADLVAAISEAIAMATTIGTSIAVCGISLGGTLAAYAAQERAEVTRAVLLAPLFGIFGVPHRLTPALTRIAMALPNRFFWWHPLKRASRHAPGSYPQVASHSLAESLRFGQLVEQASRHIAPKSGTQILIINAKDPAVNNSATRIILRNWRNHGANTFGYQFRRILPPLHDFITPETGSSYAGVVNPILLRFLFEDL